tara:strand:- start:3412 stop:3735 length:324 start_codon:yes stop_codon:yes gene_type:complete
MIENQGDTTLIRFGESFTLRLDEENLNKLREHIHDAAREMTIERRDTSGVCSSKPWAWETSGKEVNAESEMVQAGIDAREKIKAKRRAGKSEQKSIDIWNPQDPVNW